MDWDQSEISYSHRQVERKSDTTDSSFIQKQFRQFLREFRLENNEETFHYRQKLHTNYDSKDFKLVIDFQHLLTFDENLCEQFRDRPSQYLPLFEAAALEVIAMSKTPKPMKEDMHPLQIQIINLSINQIPVRKLHTSHISKLVRIPGIIISSSKPSAKATQVTFQCRNCKAIIKRPGARGFGSIPVPRTCENSSDEKNDKPCPMDPFTILADRCKFMDVQRLKLQESPEDIPIGEIPRHITLFCERRLVNKVKCGTRVNIIGIYKLFDQQLSKNKKSRIKNASVRKPYIEVVGIEEKNREMKIGRFSLEEEEVIRDMARNPDIINIIAQSIAPAIWGNVDIKKAIACLLFSGTQKILSDRMRLRGDINILLLGDPSVAKSQFLKFVTEVAPIAVYTSGKGSSAAGLTASVIRDSHSGEFHLEAGAMVLADGGVVCIDEFDKMRDTDRVAIHEAMEQQTISIAKAGITTILNSRTSVLAAANPTFGRYDDFRSTSENIDFEATILSRFDLIFIIRDIKNRARDEKLARHVMDLHININRSSSGSGIGSGGIPPEMLSKYIAYARHKNHPRLTPEAAKLLKTHYVEFRRAHKRQMQMDGRSSGIPLTVRQLESLIRISESLAKMELKEEADVGHVKEAVRLFKVSTMKAAKESSFGGEFSNSKVMESVKQCERIVKRRITVGSTVNYEKLLREMRRRGINGNVVRRTVHIMMGRGEIVFQKGRSQIYRRL